jgi:hypothetical protein
MRTISWTKASLIVLFGAALAAGCGSDSPAPATHTPEGGTCGNGTIDTGEVCDKANLNGKTCATAMMGMFTGGNLACASNCKTFVVTGCTAGGSGGSTAGGGAGGVVGNGGGPAGGTTGKDGGTAGKGGSGAGGTTGTTDSGTTDSSTPPPVDASKG